MDTYPPTKEERIEQREQELTDIIDDLLYMILEDDFYSVVGCEAYNAIVDDLKEHLLEYLWRKHGISVRRPMELIDKESGRIFYDEYPYECMVYDEDEEKN